MAFKCTRFRATLRRIKSPPLLLQSCGFLESIPNLSVLSFLACQMELL